MRTWAFTGAHIEDSRGISHAGLSAESPLIGVKISPPAHTLSVHPACHSRVVRFVTQGPLVPFSCAEIDTAGAIRRRCGSARCSKPRLA